MVLYSCVWGSHNQTLFKALKTYFLSQASGSKANGAYKSKHNTPSPSPTVFGHFSSRRFGGSVSSRAAGLDTAGSRPRRQLVGSSATIGRVRGESRQAARRRPRTDATDNQSQKHRSPIYTWTRSGFFSILATGPQPRDFVLLLCNIWLNIWLN